MDVEEGIERRSARKTSSSASNRNTDLLVASPPVEFINLLLIGDCDVLADVVEDLGEGCGRLGDEPETWPRT